MLVLRGLEGNACNDEWLTNVDIAIDTLSKSVGYYVNHYETYIANVRIFFIVHIISSNRKKALDRWDPKTLQWKKALRLLVEVLKY